MTTEEAKFPLKKVHLELLECNIDDMNPEHFPYVLDRLFEAGAKDAWLLPIIMKGGRPAHCLKVLCEANARGKLLEVIFRETTSLGVRCSGTERFELTRLIEKVNTCFGEISVKVGKTADGALVNIAPEYSDCKAAAQKHSVPLKMVYQEAVAAWRNLA